MNFGKRLVVLLVALYTPLLFATAEEDCQSLPYPSGLDRLLNSEKQKNLTACLARNEARTKENVKKMTDEGQFLVDSARNSCKAAIRKMSSVSATLAFDSVRPYELVLGTKALGVYRTDGGYAAEVAGSDAKGRFNVTCYMDASFSITNVRTGY